MPLPSPSSGRTVRFTPSHRTNAFNARSIRRNLQPENLLESSPDNYHGALVKWRNHSVLSATTVFGQIRYKQGGYCGPRIQRDYQLVVIHSGTCDVAVNGTWHKIVPGQVMLFRPGAKEHFQFSSSSETCHSWCSVRPGGIPAAIRRKLEKSPAQVGLSLLLEALLRSTLEYADVGSLAGAEVIDQLGLALMKEYLRSCETGRFIPHDDRVIKALHYMDEHFHEVDCLGGAVRFSACSRTALIKKFRKSLGQTPGRYLWQFRTEKGIAMLRNTGLNISEISEQCGFSNPYHFSRRIRVATGQSPRALRSKAWAGTIGNSL